MKNLVPIGRFSKVVRLTVKALRLYDELGLLRPAQVDSSSGYRYYSLAQAPEAEKIRLLRSVDMPLEEIAALLQERDPQFVLTRLEAHRRRVEERLRAYEGALAFLQRLMTNQEAMMGYQVVMKQIEAQSVLSYRTRTPLAQIGQVVGKWLGEAYGHIGQVGARPLGPPLCIYHDPEFKEDDVDVEIAVPVDRTLAGNAYLKGSTLPGGSVACTIHAGPFDQVGFAYQALATWIQEHGHETAGPPREVHLTNPEQVTDPSQLRTEVQWPVKSP